MKRPKWGLFLKVLVNLSMAKPENSQPIRAQLNSELHNELPLNLTVPI